MVQKQWEEAIKEISKVEEMQAFLRSQGMKQKIICITGPGGNAKTSTAKRARNLMKAHAVYFDDTIFSHEKKFPRKYDDLVDVPLTKEISNDKKKFEDWHITNICKNKATYLQALMRVSTYAQRLFCQNTLKRRYKDLGGTDWLSAGFEQEPDLDTTITDGFALWNWLGKNADCIVNIGSSDPEGAYYRQAQRQNVQPEKLCVFLNGVKSANEAAAIVRNETLGTVKYTQIINQIVTNKDGKMTPEEVDLAIKAEINRLAHEVVRIANAENERL